MMDTNTSPPFHISRVVAILSYKLRHSANGNHVQGLRDDDGSNAARCVTPSAPHKPHITLLHGQILAVHTIVLSEARSKNEIDYTLCSLFCKDMQVFSN